MSKLTNNLLHGIRYTLVEGQRKENFDFLNYNLRNQNVLKLRYTGTYMYPFMTDNGMNLRKKLQEKKVYIPILWPSVFNVAKPEDVEYKMAENILPIPIDQRYGIEDMAYIISLLEKYHGKEFKKV